MSQILGIKFSDHGPVCYFASGAHVLRIGQHVLVETDQGQALGRVATIKTPDGTLPLAQPVAHAQARLVGQDAPPRNCTALRCPSPSPVGIGPASPV